MNTKLSIRVAVRCLLVFLIIGVLSATSFADPAKSVLRCKYSVRDVAFVNVHGKAWRLCLIKPPNLDEQTFGKWSSDLRTQLERSNVGHVWLADDSDEAASLRRQAAVVKAEAQSAPELPQMFLVAPDGRLEHLIPDSSLSFSANIQRLISSSARTKVLEQVVDSLCVFVVFESGDPAKDSKIRIIVEAAVERVNHQMWTLEKPTDKGPAMVVVDSSQPDEAAFMSSVGVDSGGLPAVAVIYGQGRRLGSVLKGDDIGLEKLIGRASICGQDCECELNREWLYRDQMIHVWNQRLEREVENSLTFDPRSAFVVAEVTQILNKNNSQLVDESQFDLGGGLIIHDLEPTLEQGDVEPLVDEIATESNVAQDFTSHSEPWRPTFPLALLVGLVGITILVLIIKAKF